PAVGNVPSVDVGLSLAGRSVFEHRAVVLGTDPGDLAEGLGELARGGPGVVSGVASVSGKTVFVFPGQGAQWAGMGRELLGSSEVFAARIGECSTALESFVDWSVTEVLNGVEDAPSLDRVDVVQPVLWAVMVSLAAVWEAAGVLPAAVVGHSQGEIAAAVVCGALGLSDAARVVALRSRAIRESLAGQGGMLTVSSSAETLRERLAPELSVAAVNGPASTVVAGAAQALDELAAELRAEGVRTRRITVDYASHTAEVELIEQRLRAELASIQPRAGKIPFYSTVTGAVADTGGLDAVYWYTNLRETVEFERATRALVEDGFRVFVEPSAHPVLTMSVEATLDDAGAEGLAQGTLRRGHGDGRQVLTSLAQAFVRGVA
ncbi:MAG: acyltransferase domain-containing protein, partial [Acidimicrobiales bacterium]